MLYDFLTCFQYVGSFQSFSLFLYARHPRSWSKPQNTIPWNVRLKEPERGKLTCNNISEIICVRFILLTITYKFIDVMTILLILFTHSVFYSLLFYHMSLSLCCFSSYMRICFVSNEQNWNNVVVRRTLCIAYIRNATPLISHCRWVTK